MKILIINAILYTSESKKVKRADSIKDTMIYDLCLAFYKAGHEVTLCAAEPFRPKNGENYPFDVVWIQCKMENIFIPSRLPWMPAIKGYLKNNNFDLIISSEVFSLNTFYAYKICGDKVIAWHEIAKHQAMLHQIPSKFWYNIVAKHLLKNLHVVARSVEAREFIKKYCNNVEEEIIDHGVNLDKFKFNYDKEDYFVVCSQLIKRKRIDGIILKFNNFLSLFPEYKLVIIGGGGEENNLKSIVADLKIGNNVSFTGKLPHNEMIPILSGAKALLVNTEKDNNMISIVESIAVGTPIISTTIPLNASYIKSNKLGIVEDNWGKESLIEIVKNNSIYVENCNNYRQTLSTDDRVKQFIRIINDEK